MSQWTDLAEWVGPTPNEDPRAMSTVLGLILHIQDGNQQGSIAWCKNPAAKVSAHFFAAKSGTLQQLVDSADKAWAEAGGNAHWLSVENEGYSGQDLTAGQIEACAKLMARTHTQYKVPLLPTDHPGRLGLGWHGMGGDAWGGHPDCPGDPVKLQRAVILGRAAQLVGTAAGPPPPTPIRAAPAWPGRTLFYPEDPAIIGADVLEWQRRMQLRRWTISADGEFGPHSEAVCRAFQQDSSAHGWPLLVDGRVGEHTWAAAWERPVS
ncbi:MAG: peptidoglycan recognition protein family protein [Actinocrinis sp.]